ncbi:MAG: SMP-30/gluconolactonase/LRE family protein [Acidobacteria bacterium]|nr:SMP-30/gluconolactonase/LRE family protein [Bryobacteraceae bacterium CoA2 C42]
MIMALFLLAAEVLFVAAPFTAEGSFTGEIEGPAVDRAGNVYAVSFAKKNTIGRVTPEGKAELFLEMPGTSLANGIRIGKDGMLYVADYTGHNVLKIDPATRQVSVFAHEPRMNQPNDLAMSKDGTLWASDPDWKNGTGQLWRIGTDGKVTRVAEGMGTTNGIDLSPDEKFLYVNESVQRKVWRFRIGRDGSLGDKQLLIAFPDFAMDGMRVDRKGNLYISRHGKGTVAVVSPAGKVLREVATLGSKPSNVAFGGVDGKTIYVTEMEKGRLVRFRTDTAGREWGR